MNRIEELVKSVSAIPSVVVHLGAGNCSEYDLYKAINSNRIIFVEPDQYLAETAADKFSDTSNVKVIPHAIAAKNGRQILNITNNRRFSSLLLPTGLTDYYPNIEVDDKAEVEAITLTKLCMDEEVRKDSDNLLVAELQGMEKEVFPAAEIEALQKFKWIVIRSSVINLYTPLSGNAPKSLSEVMREVGFTVLSLEEDAPPFVNMLCIRKDAEIDNNKRKTLMAELQLSLTTKSDELDKARALVQSITAEKENQQQQLNKLVSVIDARSDELVQSHVQIQTLTAEKEDLQQQSKELASTTDARADELANSLAQIQSLTTEKEDLQQQSKELASTVNAKADELANSFVQIQSLTTEKEDLYQLTKELASTVNARSDESAQYLAQIQSLTTEKEDLQQQSKELTSTVDARADKLAQCHTQIQSLTTEKEDLQQQSKEFTSTVDARADELAQCHTQIQSLTTEKEDLQQQSKELTSTVDARADELAQCHTQIQSLTAEKENQLMQIRGFEDSVNTKEEELTEMQKALGIKDKLVVKSGTDLGDLQRRYRTALKNLEQQHALLNELKENLRQASAFYQKLNLQNLQIDSDMPEQDDSDSNDHEH